MSQRCIIRGEERQQLAAGWDGHLGIWIDVYRGGMGGGMEGGRGGEGFVPR